MSKTRVAVLPLLTALPIAVAARAPATIDEGTVPASWNSEPHGSIDIGDVVALLRTAVGMQQPVRPPLDPLVLVPGIPDGAVLQTNRERNRPTALTLPMSVDDLRTGPLSGVIFEAGIVRGGIPSPGRPSNAAAP